MTIKQIDYYLMDLYDDQKRRRFSERISFMSIRGKEEDFMGEWIFIGGSEGACLNLANMVKTFVTCADIPNRDKCICGERISANYYLMNMHTMKVVSVCEDCSDDFKNLPVDIDVEMSGSDTSDTTIATSDNEETSFACDKCGVIDYEINEYNLSCGWCKGETLFVDGIHKGKSFMQVYQNEDFYCKWIPSHAKKGHTLLFKEWLECQNNINQ